MQHKRALAGGDGPDDPVHPLGGGPAGRLVAVGGNHGGEGDRPVGCQGPGAVVADDTDPALARRRCGIGDGQPGADMHGVRPCGRGGRDRSLNCGAARCHATVPSHAERGDSQNLPYLHSLAKLHGPSSLRGDGTESGSPADRDRLAPLSAAARVITTRDGSQDSPIAHSTAHRNRPEAAPSPWTSQASPAPVPISTIRPTQGTAAACAASSLHTSASQASRKPALAARSYGQNAAGKLLALSHRGKNAEHGGPAACSSRWPARSGGHRSSRPPDSRTSPRHRGWVHLLQHRVAGAAGHVSTVAARVHTLVLMPAQAARVRRRIG